jgi:16S rRNA (cytosine1402-N4)-methyltransferase
VAEVLELLAARAGEVYVDCTAGLGGHAAAMVTRVSPGGSVVLNDLDPSNLERAVRAVRSAAEQASSPAPTIVPLQGNYAELPRRLAETASAADLVLADLGFSSNQVDDAGRGFSFSKDGPLDMRLDPTNPVTAADLVASLSEAELAGLIAEFGEERGARRIARKLVQARAAVPITTTQRLAELVRSAAGPNSKDSAIDPATRTFQALRIAVNDELGSLDAFLAGVTRGAAEAVAGRPSWLKAGARVAVISFHSLEDRAVKRAFGEVQRRGLGEELTASPVRASGTEVSRNPRSRSAKLRAVRIGSPA